MKKQKKIALLVCLFGWLVSSVGCNGSHAEKKKAMVKQWEQSTAAAKLPMIENMLEQGRIKKAKEELASCLRSNPELPGAYVLIGRIHFIESQNGLAKQAFEHAVELDSRLDQPWHYLGSLAVLEKDYERAVEHFQKAIDLVPSNIDYTLSLCDVYIETEQLENAQEVIERALSGQPQNLQLLLAKAQIYQQADQTDEAIRIYEQAQLMHGNDAQILEPCGYAYIAQQEWAKAAEKFNLLLSQYEDDDARYNLTMRSLATCLFHSGQYGQALYWYDKLSIIYRDDAEIWLNMAYASLGVDNPKRASYCAINALKAQPAWPKAYAVLGSAQYMQGLYEQSLQAFYKITDNSEFGAFAWFMTGRCYQQLGQNRQANAAFERAEELDPNNELIASFMKKTIHPL